MTIPTKMNTPTKSVFDMNEAEIKDAAMDALGCLSMRLGILLAKRPDLGETLNERVMPKLAEVHDALTEAFRASRTDA